jgi:hypothetical protein
MKSPKNSKKARDYFPEHEVLEESIKQIKWTFGIELSLIEKVALKQYIGPALDGRDKITESPKHLPGNTYMLYDPIGEVITKFMIDYYELPFEYAMVHTRCYNAPIYTANRKEFQEYIRRIQERKHLP